ncbi:response regulator [Luteolibacter sp. SL250]|uniref:response regulator n=1 Tax=Luteolibacter sp. SL250 TaxID=2995170 RepID=UPI0022710513|nr:response regulator [Luteolibacter sp. SL250]WAC18602.1 response regulator [Luteolibacter sp. SL250]
MPLSQSAPLPAPKTRTGNLPLYLGFAGAVIFFLLSGFNAFRNTTALREGMRQVENTHTVIVSLENVLSYMKDGETGQRGYLITGNEDYLRPYFNARTGVEAELVKLRKITSGNAIHQELLPKVEVLISAKFAEMEETIQIRRERGFEPALAVVVTDRGRRVMDGLRDNLALMKQEERRVRDLRISEMEQTHKATIASGVITAVLGLVLSYSVMWLLRRNQEQRKRQEWSQAGRIELAASMAGELRLELLAEGVLGFLSRYVDAHAGVMFVSRKGGFERVALVGTSNGAVPSKFAVGEGLLGRAVTEKALQRVDDVPEGYLTVASGLGEGVPRHLLVIPAQVDDTVNAVIELGFIHPLNEEKQQFLSQIGELVGMAVRSSLYRENLQELLEETQRQSEEVQTQSEELRVSNEELDEQTRALKETQARLELQQTEMEQINTQLEEQTQILERQKADLLDSKVALEIQAAEVEQASRYKSDFLANMSHELRTPLNSSLILAKLLSENRGGNLTAEQVKYAHTIESAGNDLLNLINDVLDLSKIEAGHMDISPVRVTLADVAGNMRDIFEPIAREKGVKLTVEVDAGLPATMETDPQRLEQVLKNLLSNALKFTEKGEVALRVGRGPRNQLSFKVSDTGIGIAPEKRRAIFDPFFQGDAGTSRKYGGTGLGLSISRNLARLLGGELRLVSEIGKGSTFTLLAPEVWEAATPRPAPAAVPAEQAPDLARLLEETSRHAPEPPAAPITEGSVPDDRASISGRGRVILVVEDDKPFAEIVYDLAREMSFECLVATSAEEALRLAKRFVPSAIVLDVGLPDNSGLIVLEQLKSDPNTRHIPVHVVSASDYTHTALSLGAVGYMMKPVKREQLVETFRKLEVKISQKVRRVLLVEDDPVQMDAMRDLLGSRDVEAVCASTAAECLEQLGGSTFDCMVLDLSLPDASGFALLEKLSKEHTYSFPPVIVYTGRVLSSEEEQRLRKYSKSIIIKGAKSPERLLDEVTLFLHQVVSELPAEKRRLIEKSTSRDEALEGRRILIAEDDVRNVFALTSLLEGRGVKVKIARNGREALVALEESLLDPAKKVDLVLMDVMMPEMDGITAMKEIRRRQEWKKLPIISLTAKAMRSDQEQCLAAGANDYLAKPLDVEKLLSLVRVWMPR